MAGRIPRVFINDLLARTDIVDLIDARVKLKKQGKITMRAVRSIMRKHPHSLLTAKTVLSLFCCGAHGNAVDF